MIGELIIMQENGLVVYKKKTRTGRKVLKAIVAVTVALALVIGSGFIGGQIVLHNLEQSQIANAERLQDLMDSAVISGLGQHADDESGILTPPGIEASIDSIPSIEPAGTTVGGVNSTQLSLPDLFEGANLAVVAISIESTGRNAFGQTVSRPSSGTGFLISADGYIVTNEHVIGRADNNVSVLMYDGSEHPATVVGLDVSSDIAVIKIDVEDRSFLNFADSDQARVGEQVAAIGNPLGQLANTMTVGHISALNRNVTIDGFTRTKIQTDTAVNSGNSGGPLLNLYGEVVGVVNAKSAGMGIEGLGFAIPSNTALEVVNELIEHGFTRGRPILGITVATVQNAEDDTSFVQVVSVAPRSAAAKAGIIEDDIILSAGGIEITTFEDLRAVLDSHSPGDVLEIVVVTNGGERTVSATLDEYRPAGM
jgi:serine protease Do